MYEYNRFIILTGVGESSILIYNQIVFVVIWEYCRGSCLDGSRFSPDASLSSLWLM